MASLLLLSAAFMFIWYPVLQVFAANRYSDQFVSQVHNFPNINREHGRCLNSAQRGSTTGAIYVCDPNALLSADDVKILHAMINDIMKTVNRNAPVCDENRPRPTIGIAVIQKMLIDDDKTFESVLHYASVFAYNIYDSWKLVTPCPSSKIVIFYSQDDGVLYTYAGEALSKVLTTKKIIKVALDSKMAFADGIKNGLMYVLDKYRMACLKK